jgi:hypothetical protein
MSNIGKTWEEEKKRLIKALAIGIIMGLVGAGLFLILFFSV